MLKKVFKENKPVIIFWSGFFGIILFALLFAAGSVYLQDIKYQKRLEILNQQIEADNKDYELNEALAGKPIYEIGVDRPKANWELPDEMYFSNEMVIVINDVKNQTTNYLNKISDLNKENYLTIINGSAEERAIFMTIFKYYFIYCGKFNRYMENYRTTKEYFEDKDRFDDYNATQCGVEITLNTMFHYFTKCDLEIAIYDRDVYKHGCDLGTLVAGQYWMSLGNEFDLDNDILYWLSGDAYDSVCQILCEQYHYYGDIEYEIKGGVMRGMMIDRGQDWKMMNYWMSEMKYSDIKDIYDNNYKMLVKDIKYNS